MTAGRREPRSARASARRAAAAIPKRLRAWCPTVRRGAARSRNRSRWRRSGAFRCSSSAWARRPAASSPSPIASPVARRSSSSLDRSSLAVIATAGGGRYFELDRESDRDIANTIIDATRRRADAGTVEESTRDLYWSALLRRGASSSASACCFSAIARRSRCSSRPPSGLLVVAGSRELNTLPRVAEQQPSSLRIRRVRPAWRSSRLAARRRRGRLRRLGIDGVHLLALQRGIQPRQLDLHRRVHLLQLLLELGRQLLEHLVGLIGRPMVGALDDAHQRRDLVVQPDRIVQRILAAAIAHLVDLFLDRASAASAGRRRASGFPRGGAPAPSSGARRPDRGARGS